jgi:hypothetical protein
MIGLRIALVLSDCCCDKGTDVGPKAGELMPVRAGLVGIERAAFPERGFLLLWDRNRALLPSFIGLAGPLC